MSSPEHFSPKLELAQEEQIELSKEQKRELVAVWFRVLLGRSSMPDVSFEGMSKDKLKEFLHQQLLGEVGKLCVDWGIVADKERLQKIKKEKDVEKKSTYELDYIFDCHKQIDAFVRTFSHTAEKSTMWDSWPERMRATKEFNCVGALLLGVTLLEKAGIHQVIGNPPSHVVNIVQLANGQWWYVDFMNGRGNVRQIQPKERVIQGCRAFEINDTDLTYRLIGLRPVEDIGVSVLGNLSSLQKSAYGATQTRVIDDIETQNAFDYAERFGLLKMSDLSEFVTYLYPDANTIHKTNEMKFERERVDRVHRVYAEKEKAIKGLSHKDVMDILKSINQNEHIVRQFLFKDPQAETDLPLLNIFPELVQTFLHAFRAGLVDWKETQREEYEEEINNMLAQIQKSISRVREVSK